MAKKALTAVSARPDEVSADGAAAGGALAADIIIKNAPDPVFVSDLEGKILQANDAVSELLGFRPDEVVEQSLSRFISAGRDARVHGRAARSRRARRDPKRGAQPAQRPPAR